MKVAPPQPSDPDVQSIATGGARSQPIPNRASAQHTPEAKIGAGNLTVEEIHRAPGLATVRLAWRSEGILFRPLRQEDGSRLARYFDSLSPETRQLYHPHPFTREHAQQLCAQIGQGEVVRMVAIQEDDAQHSIVSYIILDFHLGEEDIRRYRGYGVELREPICRIGPSVSDHLHGQGLGTMLMEAVRNLARQMGCAHLILLGGVFTINERAIRFYEKVGMCRMGTYDGGHGPPSWDMMMDV